MDDAKLREVFRLAGHIVHAEVTKDRDGRSRGFGTVEFEHPVESVQVQGLMICFRSLPGPCRSSFRFPRLFCVHPFS